jgi:hypothetical protein
VYKVASFDVLMKVIVKILVFRIIRPCSFWVHTDIYEELIASIFSVGICNLRIVWATWQEGCLSLQAIFGPEAYVICNLFIL